MNWAWIPAQVTLAIHEVQIVEHGGHMGLRDSGLLESAVARPRMLAAYGQPTTCELAAAYGFGLARNHPFIDGNKRTAYVTTRLFLELHRITLTALPAERVLMFLRLGAGEVTQEGLARWLERWSKTGSQFL